MSVRARSSVLREWTPAKLALPVAFGAFAAASLAFDFAFGIQAGREFVAFSWKMLVVAPAAFVLIGLFEVWVPQHTVQRHLGAGSGLRAHVWSVLLASTAIGGLVVAFPVAAMLRAKGARMAVILSYLGASGVVRVPMTLFEMSFLGVEFTLVRYAIAVPLLIVSAELLGSLMDRHGFEMRCPGDGS